MASTSLEYIAQSADEAIKKGLKELGLGMDQVTVEVLDSGSKGIFGIGGRQAHVRLTVKEEEIRAAIQQEAAAEKEKATKETEETTPVEKAESTTAQKEEAESSVEVPSDGDEVVNEKSLTISRNVVRDLMEKMRVNATVEGKIATSTDEPDSKTIKINIQGNDLSYLIGRHSETLNALQYITSLIVGREVGHWVPLVIDIQGYRERRERQLRQMASRMADQVIKSGRRIALEPMPATERRIIHLALRDNEFVKTESLGDEPNRKVVILPKAE